MDQVKQVIEDIKNKEWYQGQIKHVEELPATKPEYKKANIGEKVKRYLKNEEIKLFTHQAEVINQIKKKVKTSL